MTRHTTLPDLDEQQRYEAYDRLQQRLPRAWGAIRTDHAAGAGPAEAAGEGSGEVQL